MSLSRHTSRIYMDEYDVAGAIKVLTDAVMREPDAPSTPYYVGACLALELINNHEEIRDQSVFMELIRVRLYEAGIIDTLDKEEPR